jgi:transcription elongation factor Elf1
MSESYDNVSCPKCGKEALLIQDNDTCKIIISCKYCGGSYPYKITHNINIEKED